MPNKKEITKDDCWACGHHISDKYFEQIKELIKKDENQ